MNSYGEKCIPDFKIGDYIFNAISKVEEQYSTSSFTIIIYTTILPAYFREKIRELYHRTIFRQGLCRSVENGTDDDIIEEIGIIEDINLTSEFQASDTYPCVFKIVITGIST